jgi:hypothetical protein
MDLSRFFSAVGVLAVVSSTGCTFSPYNNEIFANTTTAVPFEGCSSSSSSPISIQGAIGLGGPPPVQWRAIASTTSASTISYTDSSNVNWYCWSASVAVPRAYWTVPLLGGSPVAVVRTLDNGTPNWVFNNNPNQCTKPYGIASMTNATPCAVTDAPGSGLSAPGSVTIVADTW